MFGGFAKIPQPNPRGIKTNGFENGESFDLF